MTLREAIGRADELRPNAIDEEQKAAWVRELDVSFAETQQTDPPAESWPEDRDLLMPEPVDRVYPLYLAAMIDWAQQDMQQYQIDQAMYEAAYAEANAYWRRTHKPRVNMDGSRWYP